MDLQSRKRALINRITDMLNYRGYGETKKISKTTTIMLIVGLKLSKEHPRPNGKTLILLDLNSNYSLNRITHAIDTLIEAGKNYSMNDESTYEYIHTFESKDLRSMEITKYVSRNYANIHFKRFDARDFIVDHSDNRATGNYRILHEKEAIAFKNKSISNPFKIFIDDIMVKYMGAILGDHIEFYTTEIGETGPCKVRTVAYVTSEVVGDVGAGVEEDDEE